MGNAESSQAGSSSGDDTKGQEKREKICSEILSTEETYIRGLTTLDRYYRTGLVTCGVKEKDIDAIFSTLPAILSLHNNQVLPQLQLRCTPQAPAKTRWCVAQVFLDFLAQYSLYSTFVNNYESALKVVAKIRKEKKEVEEVFDNAKVLKETNGLDFFSLFITIVQRLPRYVLLLQDLLKNIPVDEKEHRLLTKAINTLSAAAQEINERKAAIETMNELGRLAESISAIPVKLNTPGRRIVETGEVLATHQKKGETFKPAKFWLFNDCVLVARKQAGMLGLGKPYKVIHFAFLFQSEFIDEDNTKGIIRVESADSKKALRIQVPPPSSDFISKLYIARSRAPKSLSEVSSPSSSSLPTSSSSSTSVSSASHRHSQPAGTIAIDPPTPTPTCQGCLIQ